jgi:3-oxoacyl-[acyl-carrier-protein] synthase-3
MILKIESHLPPSVVSNRDLAALYPDWSEAKIFEKTGIRERRIVGLSECASDLAYEAAVKLLVMAGVDADYLLFCTQSPDYQLPTTACILQHKLKLPTTCAALDFNLGCSGYIYGLSLATALLQSGQARKVLLLTADTYSRLIHPSDKSTRTVFGDAGTATLLALESSVRLHSFVLGSDGSGAEQLIVKEGAGRHPGRVQQSPIADAPEGIRDPSCLYMNGPEIFNFTIKAVPKLVSAVLDKAEITMEKIDLVIFHQANGFMLEHLRRKLAIPAEKFVVHIEYCGNTVSSTIPLTLEHVLKSGRLKPGMKVLLVGFGVGYSWGGCILDWH